jgi:hypothetical protein
MNRYYSCFHSLIRTSSGSSTTVTSSTPQRIARRTSWHWTYRSTKNQSRLVSGTRSSLKRTATATEMEQGDKDMNFFTAINSALSIAMSTDETAILFGEDVAFGGVFRCSSNLLQTFGPHRVFNTPLSETGIAGFAIGYAATGGTSIAVS